MVSSATPMTAEMVCEPASNPGGFTGIVAHYEGEKPGYHQYRYTHQHGKAYLGKSVFFQSAEELRPYFIPDGEQKEKKEHGFDGAWYVDLQLSYQYAYKQYACDRPQAELPDA